MQRDAFRKLAATRLVVLDGATGTELARAGMPGDACPETWVLSNPQPLLDLQRGYVEAGADIIYACTFGANRFRLKRFGCTEDIVDMNRRLVEISRQVVKDQFLFGNMAPTGTFIAPLGDVPFEDAVEAYREQVRGLIAGGVDGFVVETMIDIQEARAALIAIREQCNLPVMVSMSLDHSGRTLTGADLTTAVVTLQAMDVDAVGCNCSTGPADMIQHLREAKPYAAVPLLAKPNAGMPTTGEGWSVQFDIEPEEFAAYVPEFVRRGVNLLGGCCGTNPEYIKRLRAKAADCKVTPPRAETASAVTSSRSTVFIGPDRPLTLIGERINPSGKKKLQTELEQGTLDMVRDYAIEQTERGAAMLDVNMGLSSIDQPEMMAASVQALSQLTSAPLSIDTTDPDTLEAALRLYPGRALVNSISAEVSRLEQNLPIAAKYGAMIIVLPMTDAGLPENIKERRDAVRQVMEAAHAQGYRVADMVIDGLTLASSSVPSAAEQTLELIEWTARELGANSVVGLSNVSFGLPGRQWINASFLSMCIARGLTMAIANPLDKLVMAAKYTSDALWARDDYAMEYIRYFRAILQQHTVVDKGGKDGYESMYGREEAPPEADEAAAEIMEDTLSRRQRSDESGSS